MKAVRLSTMSATAVPINTVSHLRRLSSQFTLQWNHHISLCVCCVGNRNLFLELLPLVGSHDSMLLVRDLVIGGTVRNDTAIRLLSSLPFNVYQPSEQLLTDLEVVADKLCTANCKLMTAIHSWTCCGLCAGAAADSRGHTGASGGIAEFCHTGAQSVQLWVLGRDCR